MTAPTFTFKGSSTSRGLTSSGEGSTEFYHPLLPFALIPAAGFLLILNGWNLNRCKSDITTTDDVRMLQMRAPRQAILPLLTWPGSGRVFRPGAKWRYRWKNSITGEFSGPSPIPDQSYNVGIETPSGGGTYIGQTAYFYIPTSDKPSSADTIELLSNSTQEDQVWYVSDSQPTGVLTYVLLTDNFTDDELFTRDYVVTGNISALPAGWTWREGVMPPCVKAWKSPAGRVGYYGIRRFGLQSFAFASSVTQGSDLISLANAADAVRVIEPGRVGQRVKFFTTLGTSVSGPIRDPTVYRFVKAESPSTFRIYPEIQTSLDVAAGATVSLYYQIEDDRDARWTYWSEPNKPWLIDPLKTTAAGDDFDDGALHWFALPDGRVFTQTKRRIYEALNSQMDDPSRSVLFLPRSEEGACGLWAGCETPFGWVYVHESRGVRLFDGQNSRPLGGDPDPFMDFLPLTQFQGFEPSMMEEVRCFYDGENRTVVVSYVPTGQSSLKETLVFSTSERIWRGPYRECVSASGLMRSTATNDTLVTGDDYGNLAIREAQVLDMTPTLSGFAGTGTLTSFTTQRVFNDSFATFNGDSDERARGSIVWFSIGTTYAYARIADVLSSTQLELDGQPITEDGAAFTLSDPPPSPGGLGTVAYGIGSIRWVALTSYIDADDDPAKPLAVYYLDTRFVRGTSSEVFDVTVSKDGDGTFIGVRTSGSANSAVARDVQNKVHGQHRLMSGGGAVIQLRIRGLARNGDPKIGKAILIAEEREGAKST